MSYSDYISVRHPELGRRLGKEQLATLPTPVRRVSYNSPGGRQAIHIKCDDLTGTIYGGNKVRKLEYALLPARVRGKQRVATFGAVGSNHALATALYARSLGLECTCFLSHQSPSPEIADTLQMHMAFQRTIRLRRQDCCGANVRQIVFETPCCFGSGPEYSGDHEGHGRRMQPWYRVRQQWLDSLPRFR